jgi:hypothetical protein
MLTTWLYPAGVERPSGEANEGEELGTPPS